MNDVNVGQFIIPRFMNSFEVNIACAIWHAYTTISRNSVVETAHALSVWYRKIDLISKSYRIGIKKTP